MADQWNISGAQPRIHRREPIKYSSFPKLILPGIEPETSSAHSVMKYKYAQNVGWTSIIIFIST